jgi:hypothetical protein
MLVARVTHRVEWSDRTAHAKHSPLPDKPADSFRRCSHQLIHGQIEVERSLRGHFGTMLIDAKKKARLRPLRCASTVKRTRGGWTAVVVAEQQIPASLLLLKEDRFPR